MATEYCGRLQSGQLDYNVPTHPEPMVITLPVDRVAVNWSRKLEVSEGMGTTGETLERVEVPCKLDMAVGSTIRGMAAVSVTVKLFKSFQVISVTVLILCK